MGIRADRAALRRRALISTTSGTYDTTLSIPTHPGLLGMQFYLQLLPGDLDANTLTMTN